MNAPLALGSLLLFSLSGAASAAGGQAAAAPSAPLAAGPAPLFAAPAPVLVTAVSDLLWSGTGEGLMRFDPYWSEVRGALQREPALAAEMLAPVLESLPARTARSLPLALTLKDIDQRSERGRLALLEALAAARAEGAARVDARIEELLNPATPRLAISQWEELERQLRPYRALSPAARESHDKAARMARELRRLRVDLSLSQTMMGLTLVQQPDADGNLVVADFHYRGDEHWPEVVETLRRAVFEDDRAAMHSLGFMAEQGLGAVIPKNQERAALWYAAAADADLELGALKDGDGHARAQLALGRMYEEGRGVPRLFLSAYQLYTLAASHGHPEAVARRQRLAEAAHPAAVAQAEEAALEAAHRRAAARAAAPTAEEERLGLFAGLKKRHDTDRFFLRLAAGTMVAPFTLALFTLPYGWLLFLLANAALWGGLAGWSYRAKAPLRAMLREALKDPAE